MEAYYMAMKSTIIHKKSTKATHEEMKDSINLYHEFILYAVFFIHQTFFLNLDTHAQRTFLA